MKSKDCRQLVLLVAMIAFTAIEAYSQNTRYWVGSGAGPLSWTASANWSATSGGTGGATVPVAGDIVIFNGAGGFNASCTFSSVVNLSSFTINGTYSGTITQANSLTVTGALTMSTGVFSGATQAITVGSFSQTGGIFTATSGTLKIQGNADFTSGVFDPNGGTIDFHITAAGPAITITGSPTVNDIIISSQAFPLFHTFNNNFVANNITIDLTVASNVRLDIVGSLRAKGYLKWTGSAATHQLTGGTIFVEGDILLNTSQVNTTHPTNAATIEICGTLDQNLNSTVAIGNNALPKVRINKPSGTLNLIGVITASGPTWTYVSGGMNPGTSTLIIYQPSGGPPITVSGNQVLNNVSFILDYNYTGLTLLNNLVVENLTLNAAPGLKIVMTGTVTVNKLLTLTGSGSNIVINGGLINAKGDINLSATYTTMDAFNTGTIEINGTGNQTITGSSSLGQCVLPNITINKPAGTLTLLNRITLQGNWNYIQGTVDASSNASTVFVTQFSTTVIPVVDAQGTATNMSFHHLRVNNAYPSSVVVGGALDVNGDLRITASTTLTNTGNYPINIAGDFVSAGAFSPGNGTVTFDGPTDQNVTSSGSIINKLVIDKNGGNVLLQAPLAVKAGGELVLTKGNINTTAANVLTLNDLSTTTLGSAAGYVDGPLIYSMGFNGTRILNLPLGAGGAWRPAELTLRHNNATPYSYRAEVKDASASALGYTVPSTITHVNGRRYLQVDGITPVASFVSGTVKLYFGADDEVLNTSRIGVAVAKTVSPTPPTAWTDISGGLVSGSGGPPYYTSGYATSRTFAPIPGTPFRLSFALANSTSGGGSINPLPIELVSFAVQAKKNSALLTWETKSELNNDYFSVERSLDGSEFQVIGQVAGAGTSKERQNYSFVDSHSISGTSYYRLRQLDYNRQATFSSVVRFQTGESNQAPLEIYPNPSNGSFLYFDRPATVRIINALGQTVAVLQNADAADVGSFANGFYFIIDQDGRSHKVMIEK